MMPPMNSSSGQRRVEVDGVGDEGPRLVVDCEEEQGWIWDEVFELEKKHSHIRGWVGMTLCMCESEIYHKYHTLETSSTSV